MANSVTKISIDSDLAEWVKAFATAYSLEPIDVVNAAVSEYRKRKTGAPKQKDNKVPEVRKAVA